MVSNTPIEMRFRTDRRGCHPLRQSEEPGRFHHSCLARGRRACSRFEQLVAPLAGHHATGGDRPNRGSFHSERLRPRCCLRGLWVSSSFVQADSFGSENPHAVGLRHQARRPCSSPPLRIPDGCAPRHRQRGAAFPLQLGAAVKEWVEAPISRGTGTADPAPDRRRRMSGMDGMRFQTSCARTISPPTRATALSSRCATCAPTPTELPVLAICCGDPDARADHRRRARPCSPAVNASFSTSGWSGAARHPRRRPLHVGGRS